MNFSAILVVTPPDRVEACISALKNLPGVRVHHTDPASGRIIMVQEAENTDVEVEGLKSIKSLNEVSMAEMINHYFEEDAQLEAEMPIGLAKGRKSHHQDHA